MVVLTIRLVRIKEAVPVQYWSLDGIVHRDGDQPAWIRQNCMVWMMYGKKHREGDLPAVIDHDTGLQQYWKYGKLHRDGDLPAVIERDYRQEWFYHGQRHRLNGLPAVIDLSQSEKSRRYEQWEHGRMKNKGKARF